MDDIHTPPCTERAICRRWRKGYNYGLPIHEDCNGIHLQERIGRKPHQLEQTKKLQMTESYLESMNLFRVDLNMEIHVIRV